MAVGEHPMPVRVLLQGDNVDRGLLIRITGSPMMYVPVELARDTRKQLFLYTEPATTRLAGGLPRLEILEERRRIHEETLVARAPPAKFFVPVVGGPSLELSLTASPAVTPESLPRDPRGYSGLNGLIVYPDAWEGIHPAALEALSVWVQGGGTLLVPTIAGSRTLLLPSSHPFGPLRAGRVEAKPGFFSWMEHALGLKKVAPDRVEFEDPWDRATLSSPPSTAWRVFPADNAGDEEAIELPTVLARQRYGRGNLYFLCFDPAILPRSGEWEARDAFVRKLLAAGGGGSVLASEDPLLEVTAGARRLVLPGTRGRTSTGWFLLFLVVYLALIAPADYWLVRRLGRPRLTWLSFPVLVLVFSFFAWGLGRGRIGSTEYREITWIDAPLAGKTTALAHSVVGIYSDTNQRFTITPVAERAEVRPGLRDSGGEVEYDERIAAGAMVQKMHIWSDHAYRVVWQTERLLDSATLHRDSQGSGVLRVTGVLPRDPVLWRVVVLGETYDIPHSAARVVEGEGWDLRIGARARSSLGPEDWDAIGGAAADDGIGALADEFYGASRRGGPSAWVAAVLPGAWPALRIAERSPEPAGAVVVRVPVEVAE